MENRIGTIRSNAVQTSISQRRFQFSTIIHAYTTLYSQYIYIPIKLINWIYWSDNPHQHRLMMNYVCWFILISHLIKCVYIFAQRDYHACKIFCVHSWNSRKSLVNLINNFEVKCAVYTSSKLKYISRWFSRVAWCDFTIHWQNRNVSIV